MTLAPSNQPYGRVHVSSSSSSSLTNRRQAVAASYANEINRREHHATSTNSNNPRNPNPSKNQRSTFNENTARHSRVDDEKIYEYEYNVSTSILLLPPLFTFYYNQCHDDMSNIPATLVVLLYVTLFLYALDLSGNRELTWLGLVVGFIIVSATLLYNGLLTSSTSNVFGASDSFIIRILSISMNILLHFCLACWATLSFRSLYSELPPFARMMHNILHTTSPIVSSSVFVIEFIKYCTRMKLNENEWVLSSTMTIVPHLWYAWFSLGLVLHASVPSSYKDDDNYDFVGDDDRPPSATVPRDYDFIEEEENSQHPQRDQLEHDVIARAISSDAGRFLSYLLLIIPSIIQVMLCFNGILVYNIYDIILVMTIPWLALDYFDWKGLIWWKKSLPQFLQRSFTHRSAINTLHRQVVSRQGTTIRSAMVSIIISTLAVMAFLYRHIVPLSVSFSRSFHGKEVLSPWRVVLYLTIGILFVLAAFWFHGKQSSSGDRRLFGEYHEDVFQVLCALGTAFMGFAFSLPMSLMPIVILGTLSLGLFIGTKMLRFASIFLTMMVMVLYVVALHRFHFIKTRIWIYPGTISLSLHQFSMLITILGCVGILVYALVVRPRGGILGSTMKKIDISGIMLIVYSVGLAIVEASMMYEPIGAVFGGQYESEKVKDHDDKVYNPTISLLTGISLIIVSLWLKRNKEIGSQNLVITTSICAGKVLTVILLLSNRTDQGGDPTEAHATFLRTSSISSLLLFTISAPYVYLNPNVDSRVISYKAPRHLQRRQRHPLEKVIHCYLAILLPVMIGMSVPTVLKPLIHIIVNENTENYYGITILLSEIIGYSCFLWGLVTVTLLTHILPNGGADTWRKLGASSFFLGLFMLVVAPSTPIDREQDMPSVFAAVSSLGQSLTRSGRQGGWGLISSSSAILLALTGPLDLKQKRMRRPADFHYLSKIMIFSIMFGCGISWFVIMQMVGSMPYEALVATGAASIVITFLSTTVTVIAFYWDEGDFDFVNRQLKRCFVVFPTLILIVGVSCARFDDIPVWGIGGWLSIPLFVCGIAFLSIAMTLRCRKVKSSSTCGTGNVCCIISWMIFIVLTYGHYGVESIHTIIGMAPSIFFTVFVSLILLLLDSEQPKRSVKRRQKIHQKPPKASFGINLPTLDRYSVCIGAAGMILHLSSLQVMFFSTSHQTYEDVFEGIYGKNARSSILNSHHDVAEMAMKKFAHNKAVIAAAGLSAGGFRTATNYFGPMLHLVGYVATLPSWCLFYLSKWGTSKFSASMYVACAFLNIFPVFLCKAIPSLQATGMIGMTIGCVQSYCERQRRRNKRQRI